MLHQMTGSNYIERHAESQPGPPSVHSYGLLCIMSSFIRMKQSIRLSPGWRMLVHCLEKVHVYEIKVGTQLTLSKLSGVMKLNSKSHVECAETKTNKTGVLIATMLPNISGSRPIHRPVISGVVSSFLLYAASVWPNVLNYSINKRKNRAEYRISALRTYCVNRTTFGEQNA